MYEKAQDKCIRGYLGEADVYILRSILLGENATFYGRGGPERHAAVWGMVKDPEMVSRLEDHHVLNHLIYLLQESDPQA
eukprot:1159486-Karenia_brevis.AAC.1